MGRTPPPSDHHCGRASSSSATTITWSCSRSPEPTILPRTVASWHIAGWRKTRRRLPAIFLRETERCRTQQELLAAKLMGQLAQRRASRPGTEKDDPELGADRERNNNFDYGKMDPLGYAVPLGAHIRRMNSRDTAANMNRRRMLRRGATYGPPLPEGAVEDGQERGIAAFVLCASLIRQFEFAQNVWINDPNFTNLETSVIR